MEDPQAGWWGSGYVHSRKAAGAVPQAGALGEVWDSYATEYESNLKPRHSTTGVRKHAEDQCS